MVERLRPSNFHGHVIKSLKVSGFILTETEHGAYARWPIHAHENSHFCYLLRGTYTERYGKKEVLCPPSTLTYLNSGEAHEDLVHDLDCRVFVLEIPPQWIARLRADSLTLASTAKFYGGALAQLCARLNQEFHKTDSAAKLAIEGLALELMAEAARQPRGANGPAPGWLRQAREMVIQNFPETLRLTQIADEVGVHPAYLATAFRQKYGVTIGEFVRKLRIEHARAELVKGDLPLAEIALQAGFVDQSHFSKVFKLYLGTSPARYRRAIRSS